MRLGHRADRTTRVALCAVMESPSRAWPLVKRWIDQATNEVTTLPADPAGGERALEALEVTERSVLGALAVHTGGLSIDHGWLRVLGGPALLDWRTQVEGGLIVGHDVVAGFYAVDRQDGEVRYLAPDTLEWEGTEMGHAAWVHWTLTGEIGAFYEALRWPGWEDDSGPLALRHRASRSIRRRSRARAA